MGCVPVSKRSEDIEKMFEIKDVCPPEDFQAFMKTLGPRTLKNFDHFYWDDTYKTFYVYEGKTIIAYGFLRKVSHPRRQHVCILGMVVADSHQGKGVGTYLGKEMIKWAKGKYKKIALGVYSDNKNALKLYYRLDFEEEGVLYQEEFDGKRYRTIYQMALFL